MGHLISVGPYLAGGIVPFCHYHPGNVGRLHALLVKTTRAVGIIEQQEWLWMGRLVWVSTLGWSNESKKGETEEVWPCWKQDHCIGTFLCYFAGQVENPLRKASEPSSRFKEEAIDGAWLNLLLIPIPTQLLGDRSGIGTWSLEARKHSPWCLLLHGDGSGHLFLSLQGVSSYQCHQPMGLL